MFAFGDAVTFIAFGGAIALVPTAAPLWQLQRAPRFWGVVTMLAICVGATGALSALPYIADLYGLRAVADFEPFAFLRLLLSPFAFLVLLAVAFVTPRGPDRRRSWLACGLELVGLVALIGQLLAATR